MKTLKTLTAALLIVLSANAFARDDSKSAKMRMDYAINTYVEAVSNGHMKDLPAILDENVKYTVSKGTDIHSYSKAEMLEFFKNNENIVQNCKTDYTILEGGANQSIIKVSMKYDSFTKINLITLTNSNRGWKITNVSVAFN